MILPPLKENIIKAEILEGPEIKFIQTKQGISFQLPENLKENKSLVIKLIADKNVTVEDNSVRITTDRTRSREKFWIEDKK